VEILNALFLVSMSYIFKYYSGFMLIILYRLIVLTAAAAALFAW
jgi:hypothetical protein